MSHYTTELRFICESYAGKVDSVAYHGIDEVISKAIPKVFDFDFPLFDPDYRNVLCGKILKHYYTREIGEETVGLWKFRLATKMNEIMPYYNQLYKSEALEFNPFYDVDYKREGDKSHNGTDNLTRNNTKNITENTSNSLDRTVTGSGSFTESKTDNSTSENTVDGIETRAGTSKSATTDNATSTAATTISKNEQDKYSDTPQGALTNVISGDYLTNARVKDGNETNTTNGETNGSTSTEFTESSTDTNNTTNKGTVKNTGSNEGSNKRNETVSDVESGSRTVKDTDAGQDNRTVNATDDYFEHVVGKMNAASYSELLIKFRETFLNIDMMVIQELSGLFMNLW